MSGSRLTSRETEILRILQIINAEKDKFTLIGGYAVDAYSPLPSYSADCDVVISESDFDYFAKLFSKNGFEDREIIYRSELEGLKTWKFEKQVDDGRVSIDLLVDGVKCRQTDAIWTYQEIKLSSNERRVVGVNSSVLSRVAKRELLIAMKLHSGRDPDLRDVTMIVDSADWNVVRALSNKGSGKKVASQLKKAKDRIMRREFEQELKAYYGSKQTEDKRIRVTLDGINRLLTTLT